MGTALSFNQLRNDAHQRAQAVGLPTNRAEAWRYVNLRHLGPKVENTTGRKSEHYLPVARAAAPGVVLANGFYDPGAAGELPAGVSLRSLAGDSADDPVLDEWKAQLATYEDVTACWTLADMKSAIILTVEEELEDPLLVINLATDGICAARLRIDLLPGASARIALISTVGILGRSSLGLECRLGAGSRLSVDDVEAHDDNLGEMGELFLHGRCTLAEGARLEWHGASRGGSLVRRDLRFDLAGHGARCEIGSATRVRGENQSHQYLRVRHRVGGTTSRQRVRAVAEDHGQVSFDGLVAIDAGADGSDATQQVANLQLSDRARVSARPQLAIEADDVVADHGCTIGRHDEAQQLYLKSRGLDPGMAERLLTAGFLTEVLQGMSLGQSRGLAATQLGLVEQA